MTTSRQEVGESPAPAWQRPGAEAHPPAKRERLLPLLPDHGQRTSSYMPRSGFRVRGPIQNAVEQRNCITEIRDDHIGADFKEPVAFPGVEFTGAVVSFITSHGNRQAAGFLGVLNLDVAVPKGQQLLPG